MSTETATYTQLEHINRLLTALSHVNRTILRVRDDQTALLHEAGGILRDQLGYHLVWLDEVDHRGETITATHLHRSDGQADPATDVYLQRLIGRAAITGERILHESVSLSEDAPGSDSDWRVMAFPVPINASRTFVLLTSTRANKSDPPSGSQSGSQIFAEEEARIVEEIALDLGFALETMAVESRTRQAESALQISEERFRRLAENSMVGIVLIQNDRYRYVNPAFATMFGYASPGDLIDRLGPTDLAAPESRELVQDNVEKRVLGQVRAIRFQYRGCRSDGTHFDVEEYGARTIHAHRLAIIATVLDVTAREAARRRLETLSEAGLTLTAAQDLQEALTNAVEQVTRILPCDSADIVLLESDARQIAAHAHAGDKQGTVAQMRPLHRALDEIPGLKRIARSDQPAIVGSLASLRSNRAPADNALAIANAPPPNPVGEIAGAPLVVRGQLIGLLIAEATQSGQFSDDDARHLRLFADHVAATLQHLRLIASLEEERNRLQTLNRLSRTLAETLQLQEVASRAIGEICHALRADIGLLYLLDDPTPADDPAPPNLHPPQFSVAAAEGIGPDQVARLNEGLAEAREEIAALVARGRPADRPPPEATGTPIAMGATPLHRLEAEVCTDHGGRHSERATLATLHVPLEAHGEIVGLLAFLSAAPEGFPTADAELVQALGVQVALAIQNARFYERAARQAAVMAEALHRQEELDLMKDELIQNISHELRTPLALVMGYAEMLHSGQLGQVNDEQATAISVITRRSRMLRSLVEDIALLWHLERRGAAKESVDLRALIETTVAEFAGQADEGELTLLSTLPAGPVEVDGAPVQIRRVLDNLIGNALKFTPPGGQIAIDLRVSDGCAELSVSDNGIGVPDEKLQRIFERFYQVDGSPRRKHGGTGLGLALVKAIVEAHGGTVCATSPIHHDPERPGTRITARFPLADAAEDAAADGAPSSSSPA